MANCNCDPNECTCAQTSHVYKFIPNPDDPCKVIGASDDGCGVDWKFITAECIKLPEGYTFCGKVYTNLSDLLDDMIISVGCAVPAVTIQKTIHFPNGTQDGPGTQLVAGQPVRPGSILWVKIVITNTDAISDVNDVEFTDVLPSQLFNTNNVAFPQNSGSISANGDTFEFSFQVQVDPAYVPGGIGILENTVSVNKVNGSVVSGINDIEQLSVEKAVLSIVKLADQSSYVVGDDVTYTVTVTNTSQFMTATNVIITDTLPSNIQYNTGSASQVPTSAPIIPGGTITWTIGSIAPGSSVNIGYTAEALTAAASVENFAQVAHDEGVDSDSDPVQILALNAPLLGISKIVDVADVVQTATQTWTITVTNTGGDTVAGDVQLVDFIPVNSSFDIGSATVEINGGGPSAVTPTVSGVTHVNEAITFSAAQLGGVISTGDIIEIVFTTTADIVGSENNLSRITWNAGANQVQDTQVSNVSGAGAPLMDATLQTFGTDLLIGEEVTFILTSQNVGAAATLASDVEVINQLPAELAFVTGSGEFQINGGGYAPLAPTVAGGPGGGLLTFAIAPSLAVSDTVDVRYRAEAISLASPATNDAHVEWDGGASSSGTVSSNINITGSCLDDPNGLLGEFGAGTVICADINPSDINNDLLTGVIYDPTSAFTINGALYVVDNGGFVYEMDPDSGGTCPVHANAGFPPTGGTGIVYQTPDAGRPHNPGTYPEHDLEDVTRFVSPLSSTKRYYTVSENAKEIRVLDAAFSLVSTIDLGAYIAYTPGPANDYSDNRNAGSNPMAAGTLAANDFPGLVNAGPTALGIYEDSDSKVWIYAASTYDGSIYRKELTSGSDYTATVVGPWEFVNTPSNSGTVASPGAYGAFGDPEGDGADYTTSTFYSNFLDAVINPGGPPSCLSAGGPEFNRRAVLTGLYILDDYMFVVNACLEEMYAIHLTGTNKHKVQQVWDMSGTDLSSTDVSGLSFGEWGGNRYLYISTFSNSVVRYPWPVCLS